ncbi:hypothetical protein TSUD_82640 [Trifolium subterraneum]|uniref:Uncharacterized protein n=1 Tax=Trifolium subterraneum TaxID=3900 RepID=A0A2Z6LWB6_TRISU|nr:hypothetical protein TSUD_82640 [Trifolium subterraneum]
MSGSGSRNNEKDNKEGEGSGGWASTFLKVAGTVAATAAVAGTVATTAAVAGSIYGILQQPEADVAPYRVHTILSITLFNEF